MLRKRKNKGFQEELEEQVQTLGTDPDTNGDEVWQDGRPSYPAKSLTEVLSCELQIVIVTEDGQRKNKARIRSRNKGNGC